MGIPLAVLAALSLVAGFIDVSALPGGGPARLTGFLETALPAAAGPSPATEAGLRALGALASLLGIAVAYVLFLRRADIARRLAETPHGGALHKFWFSGWGFDRLYDRVFVRPFTAAARLNRDDVVDSFCDALASLSRMFHEGLRLTQTGRLRLYAAVIAAGTVVIIAEVLLR